MVLPGLTSFVQELPWAGTQQKAQHLHLYCIKYCIIKLTLSCWDADAAQGALVTSPH